MDQPALISKSPPKRDYSIVAANHELRRYVELKRLDGDLGDDGLRRGSTEEFCLLGDSADGSAWLNSHRAATTAA